MRELLLPQIKREPLLPFRVEYSHPAAKDECAYRLVHALRPLWRRRELICVCIGTDRSTGDSLGPLVGTLLEREAPPHLKVYGTLDEPVHALNLDETLKRIRSDHPAGLVLAVDACLGQLKSVGSIQLSMGPVKPGAGVNKELPEVGELHITGIVNVAGFMEYFVLQNTRLGLVMKMADVIAASLIKASHQLHLSPA
jgi:putative sporulation protein YyaC